MCEWLLLIVSREINHFSKSFRVMNIKKAGFWFVKSQDSVFAFRDSIHLRLEYFSGFVLSRNAP